MRTLRHILLGVIFLAIGIGCDSNGISDSEHLSEPDPENNLTLFPEMYISNGIIEAKARYWGSLSSLKALTSLSKPGKTLTAHAGIWMASENSTITANAFGKRDLGFQFAPVLSDSTGYFMITRDSLVTPISNWPWQIGAPSDADNQPKMFGDTMGWSLFQPDPSNVNVMENVTIGMTTYLSMEVALSDFAFHRFDIINTSEQPISNLYLGYGADMDINPFGASPLGPDCEILNHHDNQMGLDLDRFLHYVYMSPHPEDGILPDKCYGSVSAFSVLPLSSSNAIGANKLASRMWRRDDKNSIYPEFGESKDSTPEAILNALKGFAYNGSPMIDPVTGQATKFAFTGDPISKDGWVDERNDGRQLVSMEPITLGPGEKVSLTAVWIHAEASTLEAAISSLKEQFDYLMTRSDAWDL